MYSLMVDTQTFIPHHASTCTHMNKDTHKCKYMGKQKVMLCTVFKHKSLNLVTSKVPQTIPGSVDHQTRGRVLFGAGVEGQRPNIVRYKYYTGPFRTLVSAILLGDSFPGGVSG